MRYEESTASNSGGSGISNLAGNPAAAAGSAPALAGQQGAAQGGRRADGSAGVAGGWGSSAGAPAAAGSSAKAGSNTAGAIASVGDGGVSANAGSHSAQGGSVSAGAPATTGGTPITAGTSATGGRIASGGSVTAGRGVAGGATTGGTSGTGGMASAGAPPIASPSCQGSSSFACNQESCCTTISISGGTFPMGRSEAPNQSDFYSAASPSNQEIPEHEATVAAFALDKYEVTVGRFRRFVSDYDNWRKASNPTTNAGAHPIAAGTGWDASWPSLPADADALRAKLKCEPAAQTWTDSVDTATTETFPINCVSWYVAFAFCVWDAARLPTEAEWEYAAAGGGQNRLFPWGNQNPDASRANFSVSAGSPKIVVGSRGDPGLGYFGHQDLAGSMMEWVFDYYLAAYYGNSSAPVRCVNCANTTESGSRTIRGGSYQSGPSMLRAAFRSNYVPTTQWSSLGFRCARSAQ